MLDHTDPSELIDELGPIREKEEVCPGVYLLSAQYDEELLFRDYFAVKEESVIPQAAKSYGRKLSGLWLFPMTDGSEEYKIIQYEVAKYRAQNNLPLDEPLRATAFFAAQSFPEYFGAFPVPLHTPRGCTIRHWVMDNGIYWPETDLCEEILAVCYPVWSTEQSGRNDLFFALLAEAGVQVEPNISTDNMIGIFPDSGENFLLFDRVSTEMRATE